jgi:predicted acyltransferase
LLQKNCPVKIFPLRFPIPNNNEETTVNTSINQRWVALDLLRGLSVIGMLLVVSPGDWSARYPWLDHVAWAGLSPADMVFPSFLFCVGLALPLSLERRLRDAIPLSSLLLQLWMRSFALIVLGILLNAFPDFDWVHVRLPGVLQRIGLCYGLVGTFLLLSSSVDTRGKLEFDHFWLYVAIMIIALGYWFLLTSWPAYLDREIFSVAHMWIWGLTDGQITYDPEGVLSTFPACINVLIGVLVGQSFQRGQFSERMGYWLMLGIALIVAGLIWGTCFPIIKKIWTSSFAFFSSGVSLLLLLAFYTLCKWKPSQKVVYPAQVFGSNALLAFVLSGLIGPLMDKPWLADNESFRHWGQGLMLQVISHVQIASLVFSFLVITAIFVILDFCYRRRWFIRL